jgi:ppGpp synthetase/RelA/SpoT-type nucleotidyltranferase
MGKVKEGYRSVHLAVEIETGHVASMGASCENLKSIRAF